MPSALCIQLHPGAAEPSATPESTALVATPLELPEPPPEPLELPEPAVDEPLELPLAVSPESTAPAGTPPELVPPEPGDPEPSEPLLAPVEPLDASPLIPVGMGVSGVAGVQAPIATPRPTAVANVANRRFGRGILSRRGLAIGNLAIGNLTEGLGAEGTREDLHPFGLSRRRSARRMYVDIGR